MELSDLQTALSDFYDAAGPFSILSAAGFGIAVGASFGWRTTSSESRSDAIALFFVVIGFFLMRVFVNFAQEQQVGLGRAVGALVLWIFVCLFILLGRRIRLTIEGWRLKRRMKQQQRKGGNGTTSTY